MVNLYSALDGDSSNLTDFVTFRYCTDYAVSILLS
jgi:hypothetical protein